MSSFRGFLRAVEKDYETFRSTWTGTVLVVAVFIHLTAVTVGWRFVAIAFVWATLSFAWDFLTAFWSSFRKRVRS